VDTALRQFELAERFKGEKIACLEARKHFTWYLKGVPYAGFFRDKISKVETMDEIRRLGDTIKRELR
jgi:tRNA-dihydrouridine synthase B